MEKRYISTRNLQKEINFYQAIVQGIGEDGGPVFRSSHHESLEVYKVVI